MECSTPVPRGSPGLGGHAAPESLLLHWSSAPRGPGAGADVLVDGFLSHLCLAISPAKFPLVLSPRTSVTYQAGQFEAQSSFVPRPQTKDKSLANPD